MLVSVLGLLGDPEEGVDVGGAPQQSLPEYEEEDDGQSEVSSQAPVHGLEGQDQQVDPLEDRQEEDPLDVETAQRGPGDEDPTLVGELIPAVLLTVTQGAVGEVEQLEQSLIYQIFKEINKAERDHEVGESPQYGELVRE